MAVSRPRNGQPPLKHEWISLLNPCAYWRRAAGVAVVAVVCSVNLRVPMFELVVMGPRADRRTIRSSSWVDSVTKPERPMSPAEATAE